MINEHRGVAMRNAFSWIVFAISMFASVANAELNVVVLLDDSGSMQDSMRGTSVRKIDAAKSALMKVLQQVPPDANVGVLVLNGLGGAGEWIIELGPMHSRDVSQAVNRIMARGGTPLGEFMRESANALLQLRDRQKYGDYRLLIVTDGEANDGYIVDAVLPRILQKNIVVDVIGVDMQRNHSLATRVDSYRRADDPESLTLAISEIIGRVGWHVRRSRRRFGLRNGGWIAGRRCRSADRSDGQPR